MSYRPSPPEFEHMLSRFNPEVQARMRMLYACAPGGFINTRTFNPTLFKQMVNFCIPGATQSECKSGVESVFRLVSNDDDELRLMTIPFKTEHATTLIHHGCTNENLRKLFQSFRQPGDTDEIAAQHVMKFVDAGRRHGFHDVVVDGTTVFYATPRPEDQ